MLYLTCHVAFSHHSITPFNTSQLHAWLLKEDQVLKRGMSTWETLVKVLRDLEVN